MFQIAHGLITLKIFITYLEFKAKWPSLVWMAHLYRESALLWQSSRYRKSILPDLLSSSSNPVLLQQGSEVRKMSSLGLCVAITSMMNKDYIGRQNVASVNCSHTKFLVLKCSIISYDQRIQKSVLFSEDLKFLLDLHFINCFRFHKLGLYTQCHMLALASTTKMILFSRHI